MHVQNVDGKVEVCCIQGLSALERNFVILQGFSSCFHASVQYCWNIGDETVLEYATGLSESYLDGSGLMAGDLPDLHS
jgi:hypothetical protein